jgi:hypothetical protein
MTTEIYGKRYYDGAYKEGTKAGTDITPGMGVEYDSNGDLVPVDAVEPTGASARFAIEPQVSDTTGRTNPIDDDYTETDELVRFFVGRPGDEVENALLASGTDLTTASEADITTGDVLAFNDDGSLKEATTAGAEVAVALEDVDNSGAGAGELARISVEVL